MEHQASFDFTPPAPADGEVERLVKYLYDRGPQWTPAKQILADLGINDRKLRALKSASKHLIISAPGCPGYRHFKHTTQEQIDEVLARQFSQARVMTRDFISFRKFVLSQNR